MQGFTGSEIIRILAGQLNTVAAMADFTLVEVSYGLKRLESDNDVVLDYFTLMVTLESNSDVTSPRSNNLSTSNHVSLDSRHWIPSSGGLRFDTLIFASMMFLALNVHATGHFYRQCWCNERILIVWAYTGSRCAYGSAAGSFVFVLRTNV
ncbi:hypothetical protein Tco_0922324 [Tanacetum coccineum]|uniref:Uncharacterized protein n=1 Tax=Tanacetum coccineum TaxID=301880 RepID=A0ABQ5CXQ9_9ASTR